MLKPRHKAKPVLSSTLAKKVEWIQTCQVLRMDLSESFRDTQNTTSFARRRCPMVTPQSTIKTTCIILDRYMYGPVSQFHLRV